MKRIIALLLLFASISCSAQQGGVLSYTGVVKTPRFTAPQLYDHIKKWIYGPFMSMQHNDVADQKQDSRMQIDASFKFFYNKLPFTCATGTIKYSVYIYVKDGRYRYEVTNFIHEGTLPGCSFGLMTKDENCPPNTRPKEWGALGADKVWKDVKAAIDKYVKQLLASLKDDMNEEGSGNW